MYTVFDSFWISVEKLQTQWFFREYLRRFQLNE